MRDISLKIKKDFGARNYIKSSSFIMALLFTFLCGATAIVLGFFINYFATGHFVYSTNTILESEIRYIEALDELPDSLEDQGYIFLPIEREETVPNGFTSSPSPTLKEIDILERQRDGRRFAAKVHQLENGQYVLVGYDITELSSDFKYMQWLGIASICFIILVVFVSYLISIFVVNGTNQIADTARDIMETGDLSRRIEIGGRWDDLSNMAVILNMLLDQIQELMQGVRHVSDNIAHDLRTPLTRMHNHVEALQKEDPDNPAYTELMVEIEQILATFNALLRISRIETGKQRSHFSHVDLELVLIDVIDLYDPLAEEKNIKLNVHTQPKEVRGDRDLLFQTYANLLDNAIKFTPVDGEVSIHMKNTPDNRISVAISDSGVGIDEEDKERIFRRFFRTEKSRHTPGTGLGLSLVSAVVSLHKGEVKVETLNPGLRIITIL